MSGEGMISSSEFDSKFLIYNTEIHGDAIDPVIEDPRFVEENDVGHNRRDRGRQTGQRRSAVFSPRRQQAAIAPFERDLRRSVDSMTDLSTDESDDDNEAPFPEFKKAASRKFQIISLVLIGLAVLATTGSIVGCLACGGWFRKGGKQAKSDRPRETNSDAGHVVEQIATNPTGRSGLAGFLPTVFRIPGGSSTDPSPDDGSKTGDLNPPGPYGSPANSDADGYSPPEDFFPTPAGGQDAFAVQKPKRNWKKWAKRGAIGVATVAAVGGAAALYQHHYGQGLPVAEPQRFCSFSDPSQCGTDLYNTAGEHFGHAKDWTTEKIGDTTGTVYNWGEKAHGTAAQWGQHMRNALPERTVVWN
jgi:hypothetical protein